MAEADLSMRQSIIEKLVKRSKLTAWFGALGLGGSGAAKPGAKQIITNQLLLLD